MNLIATLADFLLFADDAPVNGAAPGGPPNIMVYLLDLWPWLAIGFLFYFLLIRPQRREQGRRQSMIDALKKNDRVVTAAGIIGVVTNVNTDADEVTVKVDEANNTKLRMTRSSITRVLGDETSNDKSK